MPQYEMKLTEYEWSKALNMLVPIIETYYEHAGLAYERYSEMLLSYYNDKHYGVGQWDVHTEDGAKAVFVKGETHPRELYVLTSVQYD